MKINGKVNTILVIAGGTGGHIFPALAVADLLKQHQRQVFWLGSEAGLEKKIVSGRFPLICIDARRLRGKGLKVYLQAPWQLLKSTWQAYQAIRRIKPDVVIAMGGFVSGPGGLAAKLQGIPLVVHEQNAVAGYTNRLLARFADKIIAAYPGAFSQTHQAMVVGNPVRAEISAIPVPQQRLQNRTGTLRILILGGSQGAHALNHIVSQFATDFSQQNQLEFWHQTGVKDYPAIEKIYSAIAVPAKVQAFIDDMAAAYQWADILICRAGALTVAEIAAVGVASILVPFPAAVDDHQWHNARYLEQAGAAKIIRESDLSLDKLSTIISQFLADRSLIMSMAENARNLAKPQAAETVADIVLSANARHPATL